MVAALGEAHAPLHVALNKIDRAPESSVDVWETWIAGLPGAQTHRISATDGVRTEELLEALRADLPPGPFLFPEDEIATDPVRFFVAELVRETVFEQYEQEIPYSVFCLVQEFREEQDPIYVHVDIYVERKSQKGILIGKGGAAIKALGAAARAKIEHFLGRHVYLDLWVKPLDSWRKSRAHLGRLGFRLPSDDERTPG
jgi:GTP-binding protein Era